MISQNVLENVLSRAPRLKIVVLGDLFLDRYLDIDGTLTEPSLETGLEAYQVTRVRSYPGAAGTVINNLAALGVGTIVPITVIGDDGEGHELRQALRTMPAVRHEHILIRTDRRTPTYAKPMLSQPGQATRELNRLDIKNRQPLPGQAEEMVLEALRSAWSTGDALLVLDQVSEAQCGVVTRRVREMLRELGDDNPDKLILVDSRERIGEFKSVCVKANLLESWKALGSEVTAEVAAATLAMDSGRPAFITFGENGIWVARPSQPSRLATAVRISGPFDPVGAGDSVSAGLACAIAGGASLDDAAAFANLVASITIQQIGTTGTATPEQVRRRWNEAYVG